MLKTKITHGLLWITLLAFLVSTSGVFFIVHSCRTEHSNYIFLSLEDACCEDHHSHGSHHSRFPFGSSDNEGIQKADCCFNTLNYAKLSSDFNTYKKFSQPVFFVVLNQIFGESPIKNDDAQTCAPHVFAKAPPLHLRLNFFSYLSCFII